MLCYPATNDPSAYNAGEPVIGKVTPGKFYLQMYNFTFLTASLDFPEDKNKTFNADFSAHLRLVGMTTQAAV